MAVRVRSQITFEAGDEAEAFRTARDRLGPDAAILSQRPVKRGGFLGMFRRTVLLVTAGILETEDDRTETDGEKKERLAAFQKLLEFKQAMTSPGDKAADAGGVLVGRAGPADAGVYSRAARHPVGATKSTSAEQDVAELSTQGRSLSQEKRAVSEVEYKTRLEREVGELSERLDRVLKRLEAEKEPASTLPVARLEPAAKKPPPQLDPISILRAQEVGEEHVQRLSREYESSSQGGSFADWLAGRIPVAREDDALGGSRVMLIGPTGVGKTTTIAKLAAINSLFEKKNVVFLTADTYRIAAPEQLRTYAKILCLPMDVVYDAGEFPAILERYRSADLLLLDTAGRSHKDSRRVEEIRVLHEGFRPDAVHLVLPANMKYRDMLDVVRLMGVVPITHVLFTKLDETSTYGALLNILLDFEKPVSFLTTGQNVPNDIEVAKGPRLADLLLRGKGGTGDA